MPAVTLNGVSFAGSVHAAESVPRAPQIVTPKPRKIGIVLEAADGSRALIQQTTSGGTPIDKTDHELRWNRVPEATRAAVAAIFDLTTTFTAVLPQGTFTVQCEMEDYTEDLDIAIPGPVYYYNVTLTLRQP